MVDRAQKCKIVAIDHIVLTVHDLAKTISFYCDVLGMELETFLPFEGGEERKSLRFGDYKINIHHENSPYEPHALNPISGAIDICFISSRSIDDWKSIFDKKSIKIELGPIKKAGANFPIMSIYVRDPDQNLIEISNEIT